MIATNVRFTPRQMRALLELEACEPLPPSPIVRDAGEWREEPNGQWRLYTWSYTAAVNAEDRHA